MSWNFFDVNGNLKESVSPLVYTFRHVSAATTVVPGDYYIFLQTVTAAGPFTVTLPSAVANPGAQFLFLDVQANAHVNTVTIQAAGGDDLDGVNNGSIPINIPREQLGVISDGVNWYTT